MNSHDVGRGRGGLAAALSRVTATTLVIGIDSDRLFPVEGQELIASLLPATLDGRIPLIIRSDFGHDGFLIEDDLIGGQLRRLFAS
ncbi:homoserine O-acetyltransferase [Leifsonia xyli subsp. cynodontis DSM 46306]|uniref:Homoserine O-acetyltransferase n=1 Tax=Leifsonia xyli subsp. cynodontis DSM 46306 TaxID=1389489 RepID=U3P789_LEIXC|nr:homoserine O-acetyltransferase [Leifsonia xyli subsp. cynodontis DSM 46306]